MNSRLLKVIIVLVLLALGLSFLTSVLNELTYIWHTKKAFIVIAVILFVVGKQERWF